jgi:Short C-terminal domain
VAKTYEFEFDAPPEQLYTETLSAVTALGFSILRNEDKVPAITFNTGPSIWSPAGQDMTAKALPVSPSTSKLVVSGRTAPRGEKPQYGSWGERGRIAKGLAARVRGGLVDHAPRKNGAPLNGTPPNGVELVDELARLADLHRSGALSDAEFAQAKERLLGG